MNIALIRTMDSQGRIVIPAEIRKQMKLSDGDALELENVGMELLLRKCPTHLNGKEEMASYLSVLYSVIHCGIAICSEAHILVSAGIYLPEGTPVTEELAELVADGQELISAENCPVYPPYCPSVTEDLADSVADGQDLPSAENCHANTVSNTRQPVCAFFPILREDREPLALLLCSRTGQHLSEMELGCAKLVAAVIANKIK